MRRPGPRADSAESWAATTESVKDIRDQPRRRESMLRDSGCCRLLLHWNHRAPGSRLRVPTDYLKCPHDGTHPSIRAPVRNVADARFTTWSRCSMVDVHLCCKRIPTWCCRSVYSCVFLVTRRSRFVNVGARLALCREPNLQSLLKSYIAMVSKMFKFRVAFKDGETSQRVGDLLCTYSVLEGECC